MTARARNLDRPDYTGTHSTPVHALATGADGTKHLHAEISVINPTTARTMCGEWAGFIQPVPRPVTVAWLMRPRVITGVRVCLDCLSMAAAEHEVMHQRATRPARALAASLALLAEDGDDGHA